MGACLMKTLPRQALHRTRSNVARRSWAITPATNLRREKKRKNIISTCTCIYTCAFEQVHVLYMYMYMYSTCVSDIKVYILLLYFHWLQCTCTCTLWVKYSVHVYVHVSVLQMYYMYMYMVLHLSTTCTCTHMYMYVRESTHYMYYDHTCSTIVQFP